MAKGFASIIRRAAAVVAVGAAAPCLATDIHFVQPAALDQPRINAYIRAPGESGPRSFEGTFNIQAFFDTGASGVLISNNTAAFLGVTPDTFNGQPIVFSDVGVAGTDDFHVSRGFEFGLAPYHPNADVDNPETIQSVYNQVFTNIRPHTGPINHDPDESNPFIDDLDVFGVPLMQGKVVVMDPKPVDTFLDTMRTYVYNPGTPFRPNSASTDPGIPAVNPATTRHIPMTNASFAGFTTTTPDGAPGPTLNDNPFIGPHPLAGFDPSIPAGNNPAIKIGYNGQTAEGSWLFDTGAAASIISENQAGMVGVSYRPGSKEAGNPILDGVPEDEQFTLTIGGIGGTSKVAGFFLDTLLLKTEEGDRNNDNDPDHIRFVGAPVLVGNITVREPGGQQRALTLDGILGMNFFVASAFVTEAEPFPIIDALTGGNFDFAVFDQPAGKLALHLKSAETDRAKVIWAGTEDEFSNTWYSRDFSFILPPNFVTVDSQATYYKEGDLVTFRDGSGDSTVFIQLNVAPGGVTVDTNQGITFSREQASGRIIGTGGLTKTGTGRLTVNVPNEYKGPTEILRGEILFTQPQNIGDLNVRSGGRAVFATRQKFAEINVIDGTAVAQSGGDKLIVTRMLRIEGTGRLDLANNPMVIHVQETPPPQVGEGAITAPGVLAEISELVARARAGDWVGPGLGSSTASADPSGLRGIALFLNRNLAGQAVFSSFHGEPVTDDSILAAYTWMGDLDLSGVVDLTDYSILRDGFLNQRKGYQYGDIDYSGMIDGDDFLSWSRGYYGQTGRMVTGAQLVVPETSLAIGVLGGLLAMRRRR